MYFTIIYNITDDKTKIKYFDNIYDRVVFDRFIRRSETLFSLGNEQTHPEYKLNKEMSGKRR